MVFAYTIIKDLINMSLIGYIFIGLVFLFEKLDGGKKMGWKEYVVTVFAWPYFALLCIFNFVDFLIKLARKMIGRAKENID